MARPLGKAFVEAVAETDGFEDDLLAALDRSVKQASKSKNFDPLVEALGDAGEAAAEQFSRRFTIDSRGRLRDSLGRSVGSLASAFAPIGFTVGEGFFDRFLAGFANAARGTGFLGGILSGTSRFFAIFEALGAPGLAGGLAAILPLVGVLVVAIPLLVSAIFALGGALFSLLGVLGAVPALLTGIIVTIAPLIIAFQGFGETITALASGDVDKFNEQLKKLSPSARTVAREIQALMPFFTQLRKDVQQTFFSRIIGAVTGLGVALGPTLSSGLQNVAFALGSFVDSLARFAAQPATVAFLSRLFQAVTEGISTGGPTIIRFLEAMIAIADASLPVISVFFENLGAGLDRFSAFLKDSAASGKFAEFLESGLLTLGAIGDVLLEVLGLLADMFLTTDESGRKFLEDVAAAVRELREFFQAPEGKEFLENMITLAEDFGDTLIFIAAVFAAMIETFADAIEAADDLGDALERLFKKKNLLGDVARFLSPLGALGFAATGGITDGPVIAGEAGREAILPLDDPVRARQVASDPLVAGILGGGDTTVIAYFDGEPFQARITRTVRGETASNSRRLTQKPRVGV